GALPDVGSHCIDTLRFLMGEVTEVQGLTASAQFASAADDTTQAILRFENGALGIVDCSFAIPHRQCPLEIYGSEGTLMIERGLGPFTDPQVRLVDAFGVHEIPIQWVNNYALEFDVVSQAFAEGCPPETDGWNGLRNTEIMLAIYRSAERGVPVAPPARPSP
ncbi:MAG: Gfo/Idh/MocA family oxidoreductase, partial [Chloroflexi bacterium]|nr:Gfo/Idh/MocA family oxidoreductase [Chloroflexota bacterium]